MSINIDQLEADILVQPNLELACEEFIKGVVNQIVLMKQELQNQTPEDLEKIQWSVDEINSSAKRLTAAVLKKKEEEK